MKRNKEVWSLIWPSIRPFIWQLMGAVILTLIIAISQVFEPVFYGAIVDIIISSLQRHDTSTLFRDITKPLGFWVGIFLLTSTVGLLKDYVLWLVNNRISVHFASRLSKNLLRWSSQRYGKHTSGHVIKTVDGGWDGIWRVIDAPFGQLLPPIVSLITVLVIGTTIDWRLTLISLVGLPVSLGLAYYSWRKASPKQEILSQSWIDLSKHLGESIANIRVIQNFAKEQTRERGFVKRQATIASQQLNLNIFWSLFHGGGSALTMMSRILVFGAGVHFVTRGELSIGQLITFLGMLGYLLTPVQYAISNALPMFTSGQSKLAELAKLLNDENDVVETPRAATLRSVSGQLTLKNISFTYRDQVQPTLKNISLTIPRGTSCALVGPSGAGKSTLAKLINRSIDPSKGSVSLDGSDIRRYTLNSLRRQIGVVTQESHLFQDTVMNNIRFVRPAATKKEVIAACKKAQAHGFISKLPKGYNSIVGERGVKLSGGERQRIAIARIFLADTPILVLDESTSALDSETEYKLQRTLKKVMKGRTTILIAHRLSTIYLADQIVVMKQGRIVDRGSHNELLKKGGLYNRLWNLQSGGYLK